MEVPVVFKEFVEALGSFRFMDVTAVVGVDVGGWARGLSGGEMDIRGVAKGVYYESGANFYKNMVTIWISTLVMLGINCLMYGLFRLIPV